MLVQLFTEIEQVKQQCISDPYADNFQQVDYALRELSNYYEKECFEFPEKRLFLSEGKTQFMAEILNIQCGHVQNQLRAQQDIELQLKEKYQQQVREAKDEARGEQQRVEGQYKEVLMKKSELEANSQILKEQLDNIKEAKTKDDEENAQTISKLRQ